MARFKWFDRTEAMHASHGRDEASTDPLAGFDFSSLVTKGRIANWFGRFLIRRVLVLGLAVLRAVCPVLKLGRFVVVSRYDDVIEVLSNSHGSFPTLYGQEMEDLGRGTQGVLGLEGTSHDELRPRIEKHILASDFEAIGNWARLNAEALIEAGNGEIDVARDLITRVATETCCRYFGLSSQDPDAFAEWAIAVSTQLFADPFGDENVRKQARIGSIHLAALVDAAILRVQTSNTEHNRQVPVKLDEKQQKYYNQASLIDRLITYEGMAPELVRATIVGMATGFVPTNTLAAGNMLEELLDRPSLYAQAVRAAIELKHARKSDDKRSEAKAKERLEEALLEAARFNPALSPGIWRQSPEGGEIHRQGGRSNVVIRPGSVVMVSILSALRDGRMPNEIADNPRTAARLIFGSGPHSCIGARIAMTQIVETFAALLGQAGLAPARGRHGWMQRAGVFPVRFDMRYDSRGREAVLLVSAIPVREGVAIGDLRMKIEALGFARPSDAGAPNSGPYPEIAARLAAADNIQFVSLNVIEAAPGAENSVLLVEVNGDGNEGAALRSLADALGNELRDILALCAAPGEGPGTAMAMAQFMLDRVINLRQHPWGATGLHFNGLPGLTVADIARQEAVAEWARRIVDRRVRRPGFSDGRAVDILVHVRRLLKKDPHLARRRDLGALMKAIPREVEKAIVRPSRKRLSMADWHFRGVLATVGKMLASKGNRPIVWSYAISVLVVGLLVRQWALPLGAASQTQQMLANLAGLAGGLVFPILLALIGFGLFLLLVRIKEKQDISDPRIAAFDHVEQIAEREDLPGFEQNHIIALMPLKPGLIRRVSLAFSMWWIREAVTHWFRPGFVATMGTIHKARWFLVPGTRQFVFQSNYDGSWESYLEDFITRVNEGQSSAWSHGVGFPPTRFLVFDGASDGDRFKRWVRRQQQPTQFWYSRFPHLTAKQIRRNAMIEDGLARSATDTDARRWLANFGSAQREVDELESQEAQAIVFSGLKRHQLATALAVRLPSDPNQARGWVGGLLSGKDWPRDAALASNANVASARIAFGDLTFDDDVLSVGFTADGLECLGLTEKRGLGELPAVFRMGMHGRRILGDPQLSPELEARAETRRTRWNDNSTFANGANAVLMVYSPSPQPGEDGTAQEFRGRWQAAEARHREQVDLQIARLGAQGGRLIHAIPCQPVADEQGNMLFEKEHFGFRDGISQPAIRGSRQVGPGTAPRDVVAPGEFLLGYRNDQGYVSPSVRIGAEWDGGGYLPVASANEENRYPWFGSRSSDPEQRDFGRNGSYLVLRQLDQEVDQFNQSLLHHADVLLGNGDKDSPAQELAYRNLRNQLGRSPDREYLAEWLGAKIIGRWKDGSPLVGNPSCPAGLTAADQPDNNFAFGTDDPRGFACPLGAHVRRTNPRDSQEPGDKEEQAITNRHRILRRGRSYAYTPEGEAETRGLLFAAICSDLERQFEFVQHTWINATSFHGLTQESDPLLGNPQAPDGFFPALRSQSDDKARAAGIGFGGTNARFTIPTATGPIVVEGLKSYVTYRGGGYFILPSRSALNYLVKSGHVAA